MVFIRLVGVRALPAVCVSFPVMLVEAYVGSRSITLRRV